MHSVPKLSVKNTIQWPLLYRNRLNSLNIIVCPIIRFILDLRRTHEYVALKIPFSTSDMRLTPDKPLERGQDHRELDSNLQCDYLVNWFPSGLPSSSNSVFNIINILMVHIKYTYSRKQGKNLYKERFVSYTEVQNSGPLIFPPTIFQCHRQKVLLCSCL